MKNNIQYVDRKSLLYKSKVDYGGWTINHIVGCAHGCRFPCYAFMMSKRFGWVKNYNDWRRPKLVRNALDLLDKELAQLKEKVEVVHLSFMTDPFMYDSSRGKLIPEVKELTMQIIKRLNAEGIRVTTLTKGLYPKELLNREYLDTNEYGITLVSLNTNFKKKFEPYSALYIDRIDSLKRLSKKNRITWVSMEPYPTPNLDSTANGIEKLLKKVDFVDKIIFGKVNYNVKSSKFANNDNFYRKMSNKVKDFCKSNNIEYHIKSGTPGKDKNTEGILHRSSSNESEKENIKS